MSSHLARETWKRFGSWYGVDALERKFGDAKPPSDWCESIDSIGKDRIDVVMSMVRSKYPQFLPSLPEFELLDRQSMPRQAASNRPSTQYLLCRYLLTRYPNITGAFTYLYRGDIYPGSKDFEITGVLAGSMRVMCSDIDLDQVWIEDQRRVEAIECRT